MLHALHFVFHILTPLAVFCAQHYNVACVFLASLHVLHHRHLRLLFQWAVGWFRMFLYHPVFLDHWVFRLSSNPQPPYHVHSKVSRYRHHFFDQVSIPSLCGIRIAIEFAATSDVSPGATRRSATWVLHDSSWARPTPSSARQRLDQLDQSPALRSPGVESVNIFIGMEI
jgi:hypothetical protein